MTNKKQKKKANKNNNNASDVNNNSSSSEAATTTQQAASSEVSHSSPKDDKQEKVEEKEKEQEKEKEKEKETTNVDDDQQTEEPQQKGFKGQAKKDMQAVEGYVDEKAEGEIIDESKLDKALNIIETVNEEKKRLNDQKLQKQKDTEKIKVSKEDIDFIVKEMEVTKPEADKYLRENKGDLVEALRAMVNAQ